MNIEFYVNGKRREGEKMTINPNISKIIYKIKDRKIIKIYNPKLAKVLRENMLKKLASRI